MAEPLSLVASVIAVAQAAETIINLSRHLISSYDRAPRELHAIFVEVSYLKVLFDDLQPQPTSGDAVSPTLHTLEEKYGIVNSCRQTLSELEELYPKSSRQHRQDEHDRVVIVPKRRRFEWIWKGGRAKELLGELSRYKATISLVLQQESTYDLNTIERRLDQLISATEKPETGHSSVTDEEVREHWRQHEKQIKESCRIGKSILQSQQESRQDASEKKLLEDLALASAAYEEGKDFNPRRVPSTCEWFLTDEKFLNWRESSTSSLLWISAGPGCGKSVLARSLIDEGQLAVPTYSMTASSTSSTTSTVCYFFFKDGDERRREASHALCALLHQLFSNKSTARMIKHALPSHMTHGKALTQNFYELWRILVSCAEQSDAGPVVCVLDALDECGETSRGQIFEKLESFYTNSEHHSQHPSVLKFLVTSRPYDTIEDSFAALPATSVVHFDGGDRIEEISRDIGLVIDARLDKVARRFSNEDRNKIAKRLKTMEDRTYLWLHLAFDIIEKRPSAYGKLPSIEALLSDLPPQVSEAYEKILARSQDTTLTNILLQIVLAATRPLTLEEANVALTLASQKERPRSRAELKSMLWPIETFKTTLTSLCGLFISVYDSKLFFIHQTAREFLLESQGPSMGWKGRFSMPRCHTIIWQSCLYTLMLESGDDKEIGSDEEPESPLGTYATNYWHIHYRSQDDSSARMWRREAQMLCDPANAKFRRWVNLKNRKFFLGTFSIPLKMATYLGLHILVDDILADKTIDINAHAENGNQDTLLIIASHRGNTHVVNTLLDRGADVHKPNRHNGTALNIAARSGHEEIVRILLERGANVNAQSVYHGTALYAASTKGHKNVAQVLLDRGADVNAKGGYHGTALQAASTKGHMDVVQLLLDRGADINAQGGNYNTALEAASAEGHMDVVQLLLQYSTKDGINDEINKAAPRLGTARGGSRVSWL